MENCIRIIPYVSGTDIGALLRSGSRRQEENAEKSSMEIVEQIREKGDEAVLSCLRKFDNLECTAEQLLVSEKEYELAERQISPELAKAIGIAISNVRKFHQAQQVADIEVETMPGVICRQKSVPIEKVGLYVPGGTAPLFSTVIMLAVPAKIAGCRKIIMCTPVNKNGVIAPEVLYCAKRCGVDKVYKIGGAAAIGAMAFGTEHVERVYKIFGPGNSYVTAAKQYVSKAVCAIDMPAGPSEVMIMADDSASPAFVAADFLSQLELAAGFAVLQLGCLSAWDKYNSEVLYQSVFLGRECLDSPLSRPQDYLGLDMFLDARGERPVVGPVDDPALL